MSALDIPGHQVETLIGKGACGSVFAARRDSGEVVAVKALDPRACNPELIENRIRRLYRSAPPRAAVPLKAFSLDRVPLVLVGGLMADRIVQGIGVRYAPRTLQLRLEEYLGQRSSWMLVRRLAQVLAEFHRRRVVHGNLKPGNVFFDTDGELLLADYMQGLMPGIESLPFTDALLYAAPEQLAHPDGLLEGAGYGWDVYAFGTLAFRLLNGVFPRCHDVFRKVAPAPGEQRRPGVEADCVRISEKLRQTALAPWKCSPPTREEEEGRLVIERCLQLDPSKRYSDMREVLQDLEEIAASRQARLTRENEEKHVAALERRHRGWRTAAGLGMAASLALGGLIAFQILQSPPIEVTKVLVAPDREEDRIDPAELDAAKEEAARAIEERDELARASEGLRERYVEMSEDLNAAFALSDQLLAWSVERGAARLPTLENRLGRLKVLERSMHELLQRSESEPPMQRHRWRIKLALAEIALAGNQTGLAKDRLAEAIREAPAADDATLRRLTRARVLVCLLGSDLPGSGITQSELAETETALASLPPEASETKRLQAALQIASARLEDRNGDSAGALENYRRAFAAMTALCEEQPRLAALRVWRARGYTEAATAAAGHGAVDAALLLREQAAVELMELHARHPGRADVQVELSKAFGAIAESALENGDHQRAEDLAHRSLDLLHGAVANPEERKDALVQLATQKSIVAACLADRGNLKEAAEFIQQGAQHARDALDHDPGDPMSRYRLAVLTWQKAGLRELAGSHPDALRLGREAQSLLDNLLENGSTRPPPREIKRSLAYLTSDLGHAAQLAGRDGEAIGLFRESLRNWKSLAATEKNNPEFQDGLEWAELRLRELDAISSVSPEPR